jgi:radical SAM superfamily enzyme
MYNPDTEILFPMRVIPYLKTMRGEEWSQFVDRLSSPECSKAERFAFVLMMVRLGGCVSCNSDSFRAMRGCTVCARQTTRRFRGSDHEMIEQHRQITKEVEAYLKKQAHSTED